MSIKSKELIANTLIELMKDNPFDVITISEICGSASLVRKTFYNNFVSKEKVIEYIVEKLVAEYLNMIKEEKSFSPKEMSYLYFCFGKNNGKIMSMLIDNKLFYIFRNQFNQLLPSINILVPNNKLITMSDDDLKYVFAFHSAGVIHLLEIWIKTGFKKTAREMSDIYYAVSQGI
jgi:AcrR family transcriptional regulator